MKPAARNISQDGDKGDKEQEDGGKVGGQQLSGNLPLQHNCHHHQLLLFDQGEVLDCEHGQVGVLWQKTREFLGLSILIHHQHLDAQNKGKLFSCPDFWSFLTM